jgi:hypothetical protein
MKLLQTTVKLLCGSFVAITSCQGQNHCFGVWRLRRNLDLIVKMRGKVAALVAFAGFACVSIALAQPALLQAIADREVEVKNLADAAGMYLLRLPSSSVKLQDFRRETSEWVSSLHIWETRVLGLHS